MDTPVLFCFFYHTSFIVKALLLQLMDYFFHITEKPFHLKTASENVKLH